MIRRLRQEASRYVGPALPLPQLAVALGLDRVRSAARVTGAIVRLHPAVSLLPGALVAALMTLFVIASADMASLTTGPRAGLADTAAAAAVGGVPQVETEAVVPAPDASRSGLDAGHRVLDLVARPRSRPAGRAVLPYGKWAAWCAWWSLVQMGPVPVPFAGQFACGRSVSGLAPYTAHRPDPRAFAT